MAAVLFTCAGQRVDIVTAFREAGATTIAVDVDQLAPALYHADRRALTWHAYLWDPWFLLWGLLVLAALCRDRREPRPGP